MLWPGMCFSLRSQCKRCSAGRLHNSLSWKSFEPFVLNETKPTYRGSYATCTPWLRTHILHHDVPRISTIFILLRLNPLSQRKLPIVISLSRMLCFGRVCASCALNQRRSTGRLHMEMFIVTTFIWICNFHLICCFASVFYPFYEISTKMINF